MRDNTSVGSKNLHLVSELYYADLRGNDGQVGLLKFQYFAKIKWTRLIFLTRGLFGQNLRNGPEGPKGNRMKVLFQSHNSRTPLCRRVRILKILNSELE